MHATIAYMPQSFPIKEILKQTFPKLLHEIPKPPNSLTFRGELPSPDIKLLTVVGSRKYSTYGKQVIEHLISGLKGYHIGIVSGLALGVDSLAHEAALRHGLYTLAIPGSGIDDKVIYPARHKALARKILEANGGLLSEFKPTFKAAKWSFVQRNRIMAGISHATLLIEATEKSGTLITARLASDYNRDVLVVPGNIFSQNCAGTHQFLKLGAIPIVNAQDILHALGINPENNEQKRIVFEEKTTSTDEQKILTALKEAADINTLIQTTGLPAEKVNVLIMQMEIEGTIVQMGNKYRLVI